MEPEAWPTPQEPAREPLPRVEDLPIADQGYEQESVKAAFDSFYRHTAQLDAALRTLEAVDSFHRHAASLRADLRALRTAGWTQQSWTQPRSYGYGAHAPREGVPPAVWRIGGEVAFLVAVAVALGVAKLSWWVILLAMAGAFAIVCLIEWLGGREHQRADDTDEHDSLGWTAFEEAQEPSDAMTIIGAPLRGEEPAETAPVPAPEAEPEPEPELPPAAETEAESGSPASRDRRPRRRDGNETGPEQRPPRHVRVLPTDDASGSTDPWEEGFDDAAAPDVDTEEAVLSKDDAPRRRFRRR